MIPIGAFIVCWGGRCTSTLFFFTGGWQLLKAIPTAPGATDGLLAVAFVMEALVLIVTTESASMLLRWMVDEENPDAVLVFVRNMFSIIRAGSRASQQVFSGTSGHQETEARHEQEKTEAQEEQETEDEGEQKKSERAQKRGGARRERRPPK